MKQIRVMHCLGQLNTGGAETMVMNILRNIDRNKYQFDFLLFDKEKGFYDEEVRGLSSKLFYTSSMGNAGLKKYITQMIDFFKEKKPDVVHSHMDWQGGFIAYAAHKAGIKKIVVHSHANQKIFSNNLPHKIMITISKKLIKKYATDLCACSEEAGKSLFDNKQFHVITNGIDMNRYINPNKEKMSELKKEFNLKETDIVLGHVGSFSENKNQRFLIHLLKELVKENQSYKLILVGKGRLRKTLEQEVQDLHLDQNVIFAGVRSEIPEIMHLLDVFLFPSISEGLGIVAIEAQACNVPCILSDTITREVDLGLDLIEYVSLDDKLKWLDEIKENKQKNSIQIEKLKRSKFNIDYTINQLVEIYK